MYVALAIPFFYLFNVWLRVQVPNNGFLHQPVCEGRRGALLELQLRGKDRTDQWWELALQPTVSSSTYLKG